MRPYRNIYSDINYLFYKATLHRLVIIRFVLLYPELQMSFKSFKTFRIALPRWLMRLLVNGSISAKVFPFSAERKKRIIAKTMFSRGTVTISPYRFPQQCVFFPGTPTMEQTKAFSFVGNIHHIQQKGIILFICRFLSAKRAEKHRACRPDIQLQPESSAKPSPRQAGVRFNFKIAFSLKVEPVSSGRNAGNILSG